MDRFCDCLRREMKRQKISQEALSCMMGVDVVSVYKWVGGKHFPREKMLMEILDALNCHLEIVPNEVKNSGN